ncbi:family 43 glycosylhydrolase [Metabacillus elymi]|uniref:Family 43 glycosylhydrolase n=1 Tax=Metabacillus elymi TaxID=2745198 RepID=A0ABX6S7V0_9BACI|nr:family 43 glycosylhydrolase [Metabacillus sp. KUDC1714]QNF29842.1 family 43 glycosylhydrolase [Metabacillus sp. KUDC1714]
MKKQKFYKLTTAVFILPLILGNSPIELFAIENSSTTKNMNSTFYKKQSFELFKNPVVGEGADPWVVKHTDGYYYYTQTTGSNITIWKSKNLSDLGNAEKKVVWTPSPDAPNGHHMWAPEMHFINGKWYIYYAGSDGDMGKQRMYVLESEGSDPFGPYHHPEGTKFGKITDPSDKWAIDGTILEYKNKLYFVWSGWEGDVNVSQQLYIAPLENPWTISGDRVEISRPELNWELNGTPYINEGPQILKNKQGKVFIVYSASGSWTDDYCLGMLTLTGLDPINPDSWKKNPTPVFEKNPALGVYGPGHNSFVKSPDGKEDWIVYHAAKFKGAGWNRNVRMQKFSWNEDGTPNFRVPVAADTLQRVPSGESKGRLIPQLPGVIYKYEAEQATINKAKVVHNPAASGGAKVGYIDYEDSFIEFQVQVTAGDYTMKVRYSNGMGEQTSHNVSINGQAQEELIYDSFGWDSWKETEMDLSLNQEENTIRIAKGKLYTEIDSIELIPKEQTVYKYEAEHARLEQADIVNDSMLSNNQKVSKFDDKDSQVTFPIQVPTSGVYELQVKYANGTNSTSTHAVSANDKLIGSIAYKNNGWDYWEFTSVKVNLKAGINRITFSKGEGMADLDFISLKKLD